MKYKGMTVNERLYLSGYMSEFDIAIENNDINKIYKILKSVELDDDSIEQIVKHYGLIDKELDESNS